MYQFSHDQLNTIADALVTSGYVVLDGCVPNALVESLAKTVFELQESDMKVAGIGRLTDFQLHDSIRADKIHWISANSDITSAFLTYMESLRVGINQQLFMGLFDFESHFAHYPVGAFYKKHVDAFRHSQGQANRVLSCVLYLNHDWHVHQGGELLIYEGSGEEIIERVLPTFGRLVIFLSEKCPHEVLPAVRERNSIAGWFRVNEGVI
jgi:SM-20-related protein